MIVRLTAGLANQFFEYAFGQAMSVARNESVQYVFQASTRAYAMTPFNVRVEFGQICKPVYEEASFAYDANAVNAPRGAFFHGYWQSEKYFLNVADIIRKDITLRNPVSDAVKKIADEIENSNSYFVHYRRGDYLNPASAAIHGEPSSEYYASAEARIQNRVVNAKKFVFSDDPAYRNLPMMEAHEDFYLMSRCKHGILANSTYSWWAAWLTEYPDKIIIAPKRWFADEKLNASTQDLIPTRWIKI